MVIEAVIALSRPYRGRKYPNMTVLQRLRCDLYAEAADYDHTMMHAWRPAQQRKAALEIGDELVTIAQNYAWRYAKTRQAELLELMIENASDNRITSKETVIAIMRSHLEAIQGDLTEYQQQYPNMKLM